MIDEVAIKQEVQEIKKALIELEKRVEKLDKDVSD